MSHRIWEMTFKDVREYLDNGGNGVVIPFGTIEPHGPHLPMGTDFLLAFRIGDLIAQRFKWLITAPLNYGINNSLSMYPGATTIVDETYEKFACDLIEGYLRMGFRNLVLNNGHGPNNQPLASCAKKLHAKYPNSRFFLIDWWDLDETAREKVYDGKTAGHAGVDETAAVIYFFPELVREMNLDARDKWIRRPGIRIYPSPAACLVSDESALPDFSAEKAKKFMDIVMDEIYDQIEKALADFDFNFSK